MQFDYALKTKLPIDLVYKTLRDDLYKLVRYMPDVRSISLIDRTETEDKIITLNKWEGRNILPATLSEFIKLENIAWIDRGEWSKTGYLCTWNYDPFIFQERINARGQDIFTTDGTQTTITFTGEIYLNFDQYPFVVVVPAMIRKKIVDEFTNIILSLIQSNFKALIKGLEQYAEENKLA